MVPPLSLPPTQYTTLQSNSAVHFPLTSNISKSTIIMAIIWHPFMQNITTIILSQDIATIILFILKSIPPFYAPKRLRTYQSRGVNSFKAPNPSLTRFSLPGETEIVYPDESPVRSSAAKRGFAAELSSATGSPTKRAKVHHLQLVPPARPSSSQDLSLSVTFHGSRREVTTTTAKVGARSRPPFITRTFPVCSG